MYRNTLKNELFLQITLGLFDKKVTVPLRVHEILRQTLLLARIMHGKVSFHIISIRRSTSDLPESIAISRDERKLLGFSITTASHAYSGMLTTRRCYEQAEFTCKLIPAIMVMNKRLVDESYSVDIEPQVVRQQSITNSLLKYLPMTQGKRIEHGACEQTIWYDTVVKLARLKRECLSLKVDYTNHIFAIDAQITALASEAKHKGGIWIKFVNKYKALRSQFVDEIRAIDSIRISVMEDLAEFLPKLTRREQLSLWMEIS